MQDYQDRFPREYIRTVSLGLKTGAVPLVLGTIGIKGDLHAEKKKWIERTLFGVTIVHEIKNWGSGSSGYQELMRLVYDFGYGEPDCKVYRYWEKDFPVSVNGLDAEAILFLRKGNALVVVTDFGDGGSGSIRIDATNLDLKGGGTFKNAETNARISTSSRSSSIYSIN